MECVVRIVFLSFSIYQRVQMVLWRDENPAVQTEGGRNADVVILKHRPLPVGSHLHQTQVIRRPVQLQLVRRQRLDALRCAGDWEAQRAVCVVRTIDTENYCKRGGGGSGSSEGGVGHNLLIY